MSSSALQATRDVLAVLPGQADNMARLCRLLEDGEPIVTVIGKYNHGKSTVLNELIGQATFAVADKRETIRLADSVQQGLRWLDAPGLDADVDSEDDSHALHAAWLQSDIRLFVHAAKEGELDAAELALLKELADDSKRTRRQTLFVLSQVDQLPDESELDKVSSAIGAQQPDLTLHYISSTRHRKGISEGKQLLIQRSGIPQLRSQVAAAVDRVPDARAHETALLLREIRNDLQTLLERRHAELDSARHTQQSQRAAFDHGLRAVIAKVGADIEAMLDTLGTDYAIIPDTAKDAYASTAGKRERAYIQMAYSRACIEIDSYLAGHGVIAIPAEQETVARSLNTVMIAVMGVSVKFRKDLRRMFGTEAGRERLQHDFTHYYDISADRKALAARIMATELAIAEAEQAVSSLQLLS